MKKRLWLVILGCLFLVCSFGYLSDDEYKDNYYLDINSDIINNNGLDDGEYSWSYFKEAQDRVDDDVDLVIDDILDGSYDGLDKREIDTILSVYDKALDMDKRNSDDIKDLKPYLDKVWNVSDVYELMDVIVWIENELGVGIVSEVEVVNDYRDNTKNIIYFYPVTFAFGASGDYMVNDDYMTYKAYIRRACVELWKVYGYDTKEAREVVSRVFKFYEDVSSNSKLTSELDEIDDYYNVVNESKINDLFNGVDDKYLFKRGIAGKVYSLVDEGQYRYIIDSLTEDNLNVWQEVIVTKILSSYANYGSEEYVEVVDKLNDALLGSDEERDVSDSAKEIVKGLFSYEIDRVYVSEVKTDEQIADIAFVFDEVKNAYKTRLLNNEWLSDGALDKALLKLDKMKIIVGDSGAGYGIASKLEMSDASLISDVINIQKIIMEDEIERLDSGEEISLVSQTAVNAYYQPLDNSVVIPIAFFELVDDEASYYEKLGTLGMILSHEVTHAFDSNGSKFDENGNLNNWWSEDDKRNFEELKQKVVDYYSAFEVIDGKYIDGDKTVNENIADLGALECIVDIAEKRQANEEEYKLMFSAFAKIWASVESEEYMELLLLQDVHAPNQFRVNAVLSSIDKFYNVYNVYPWNDMWIPKDKRVMVW